MDARTAGLLAGAVRPRYADGSLVNLVRSVESAFGVGAARSPGARAGYGELAALPGAGLAERPRTCLLVVDGLGLDLLRSGSCPVLAAHLAAEITSVFPSTTASAVTSLLTGVGPAQHGLTGWFLWLREAGSVVMPLPMRVRGSEARLDAGGRAPAGLLVGPPLLGRVRGARHLVSPVALARSAYTRAHAGGAAALGYRSLEGLFRRAEEALRGGRRCLVHAYWPEIDRLAHRHGAASRRVARALGALDRAFEAFLERLQRRRPGEVNVLVTADHGFVDTRPEHRLWLRDHPEIAATLRLPLCGEPRVVYCYLRPGAETDFDAAVGERLGHACWSLTGQALLGDGWLGPGPAHPALAERVGDRVLVMREGYVLRDRVHGEKPSRHPMIGFHGGPTRAEMEVPLVVARP